MSDDCSSVKEIAIIGAGGIGCYYGARLLQAGHRVRFIARGAHLAALRKQGLRLKHPQFSHDGPVDAMSLEDLTRTVKPETLDAILVCTKATASETVGRTLGEWFSQNRSATLVVSLQNGVDNEATLAHFLGGESVAGGLAVRIGGHIVEPGRVEATGIAQVIIGAWPNEQSRAESRYGARIDELVSAMESAGIPARKVGNIRHELWRKLVINNGVNPLSALTRLDTRSLSHHPRFGPVVHALMREAASAAAADGERLTEQDVEEMYELIRTFDPIKTSMLVDLEKGRELELDDISGAVLERARRIDLLVPYTEMVYALLRHQLEAERAGE